MKCINCNNEAIGRSKYCGDSCKTAYYRNKKRNTTVTGVTESQTVTDAPVKVGHGVNETQVGQADIGTVHDEFKGYELIPDQRVYGRPAVAYRGDRFKTRPEPFGCYDKPDRDNRCLYRQPTSREYWIDATGNQVWKAA